MPTATYSYVYYEQLSPSVHSATRQNRNPATQPATRPVPGMKVPTPEHVLAGSTLTLAHPLATYSDVNGYVYNFGFMNVTGCAGVGETSTDINSLPDRFPSVLTVTDHDIKILVVYTRHAVGSADSICVDAFDETTGVFLNNNFITGVNPDFKCTNEVRNYGYLPPHIGYPEFIGINRNTEDNSRVFHKWGKLEGPDDNLVVNELNHSLAINSIIPGSTTPHITAIAFYKQQTVYITGGYYSTDIELFTPFSATTAGLDLSPMGRVNTPLYLGDKYGFAAKVHNINAHDITIKVAFWNISGEVGKPGTLLDTQKVIIRAGILPTIIVCRKPFINVGGFSSAVVSIFVEDSPCQCNPTSSDDWVHIPSPVTIPAGDDIPNSCSAWKITFAYPVQL